MSKALKESPPSLSDFSQQWPIMESICSELNFRNIASLSRTSKRFSNLPETMSRTQLNINSILEHFVQDSEALRLKMAQTNAVIVGNTALQFFHRSIRLKDGMCIIVGKKDDRDPPAPKIRDDKSSSSQTFIRVTHALRRPILAALLWFPDTSSANYITWKKDTHYFLTQCLGRIMVVWISSWL
ncbi:hypothetical protein BHYA_0005g01290 [Botrytis hyacinthi]|uniref:F-box domain-containing protein n=1 Tax=Botrytis hyacinthi TaxID=278943 RepID=A0A4Z1H4N5_9HELO|nr:hypothetical protein BHYA_0005g01290 [Botrytis hyacinthi]